MVLTVMNMPLYTHSSRMSVPKASASGVVKGRFSTRTSS